LANSNGRRLMRNNKARRRKLTKIVVAAPPNTCDPVPGVPGRNVLRPKPAALIGDGKIRHGHQLPSANTPGHRLDMPIAFL
jgi:hypothetical protein